MTNDRGELRLDRHAKYEMPVAFGPTEIPDVSHWGRVEMVSTSFVTTFEAARPLVPAMLEIPEQPVVTFSRMTYTDVDYLAGRGYNEVTVGITAAYTKAGARQRGSFMLVVWVDEFRPLIIGREYIGYAKLMAEFSPVEVANGTLSYEIGEYSTQLLRGHAAGMTALAGDDLTGAQRAASDVTVFNWKYIAGPDGMIDADYVTSMQLRFEWSEVMRGEGCVSLQDVEWRAAPHSARIVQRLRELPVVRLRPAIVARGRGTIDRNTVTRLNI
jgi:hypothetical protein